MGEEVYCLQTYQVYSKLVFQICPGKIIHRDQDRNYYLSEIEPNYPSTLSPELGKHRPSLGTARCSGRRSDAACWEEGLAHLSGPLRAPFARQFQKTEKTEAAGGWEGHRKTCEICINFPEEYGEPFWMVFFGTWSRICFFFTGIFFGWETCDWTPKHFFCSFVADNYDGL